MPTVRGCRQKVGREMTEDAAARFLRENAGKEIIVNFPSAEVENLRTREPLGVDPPKTYRFRIDEDGVIVPSWETDE